MWLKLLAAISPVFSVLYKSIWLTDLVLKKHFLRLSMLKTVVLFNDYV